MVPRESASFDAEAPWRRELNRGAAFGFGRNYSHRNGRSYDLLNDYRTQLQGRILDVGAGDQATFFREKIGNNYESLDIGDGYKIVTRNERDAISHVYNLEGRPLPFDDKSFDCVMCMDTLEHVDRGPFPGQREGTHGRCAAPSLSPHQAGIGCCLCDYLLSPPHRQRLATGSLPSAQLNVRAFIGTVLCALYRGGIFGGFQRH